jgi:hypothetical protein
MSEIDNIDQFLRLSLLVHTRKKIVIICFSNLCGVRNTEYGIEKKSVALFTRNTVDTGPPYP